MRAEFTESQRRADFSVKRKNRVNLEISNELSENFATIGQNVKKIVRNQQEIYRQSTKFT